MSTTVTLQERQEIIDEAVEQVLKLMPEVVGNLMTASAVYSSLTKEFYNKHKEFQNHREVVREVVNKIERQDITKSYEDILGEATPKINEIIKLKKTVNMDKVSKSTLDLSFDSGDAGPEYGAI